MSTALAALLLTTTQPVSVAGAAPDFDADIAVFGRYLDALRQQTKIPGLSAAIVSDERVVWAQGYGLQDVAAHITAGADTLYDIASLTKTFTSTLLMQCVERSALNLDEPISRYTSLIPEPGATVRHVLTHTSQGTPGAVYRYDGNRFAALTAVVEACQGRPFRQALALNILDRAAMTASVPGHDLEAPTSALTALFDPPALSRYQSALGRLAAPYTKDAKGRMIRSGYPPRDISASAGLLSSVLDLAKYDAAIDAHVFIGAESQQRAWTNAVSTTGKTLPYGLGWFVQTYGATRVIWHYGLWPQFSALYLKVPDRQLTLLLLANSDGLSTSPLADGDVTVSPFARAFLRLFVQ